MFSSAPSAISRTTGLTLNDRFTSLSERDRSESYRQRRSRSRSQSRSRSIPRATVSRRTTANERFLRDLMRKDKLKAAMRLKRRSIRKPTGASAGAIVKRGAVKAFRVAANGKPIRANSMTKIATMKADLVAQVPRRPVQRSASASNLAGRLGSRRPMVGGAAERVNRRRLERTRPRIRPNQAIAVARGRSRSRSRMRAPNGNVPNARARSRSRSRINANPRGRSVSRGRAAAPTVRGRAANSAARGRSRSRNRAPADSAIRVPIAERLGVRQGSGGVGINDSRRRGGARRPSFNVSNRNIATGRVQKRRLTGGRQAGGNVSGARAGRARGRSAVGNNNGRVRSRTGAVGRQSAGGGRRQQPDGRGRNRPGQGNGKFNGTSGETQQRRGRSRSRGVRGGRKASGQGRNGAPKVNKERLDMELDQYMSTTKTDADYLR